ncbi:MAG: hypothetical protein JNM78_16485 [Cyclobacteriaceae bacterium]|nr:hypothetical protein [Cyclobacteriaceae bacterium]
MIVRALCFFTTLILSAACNNQNKSYDKVYFDFDSLINVQVNVLAKAELTLTKSVSLDGKNDQSSHATDSTLVAQELDVFRQLDLINKPLYRNMYEVTDGEKDNQSNLSIRRYKAKTPAPVAFVTFYYHKDFKQIKKIESVYHETNSLYASKRQLQLEFDDSSGAMLLSKYKMTGSQKMILSDSVKFTIEASFAPTY